MLRATGGIQNLQTLFSGLTFDIPDFQRNYAWEEAQVDEFWNDLEFTFNRPDTSHFIGSVILLNESRNHKVQIIDGQQRMTTIVMTMAILRDLVVENEVQHLPPQAPGAMPINVSYQIQQLLFADGLPRFEANPAIKVRFLDCVLRDPKLDSERDSFRKLEAPDSLRLRKAYWKLSKQIREYVDLHGGVDPISRLRTIFEVNKALTERLVVLRIDCEEQHEAISVYMTLNSRGLDLTPADLLKSLIMKHLSSGLTGTALKAVNASTITAWNEIAENVGEGRLNQFLRHYLLIHYPDNGPLRSIREKEVFRYFQEMVEGGANRTDAQVKAATERIFSELQYAANLYSQILEPETSPFSKDAKFRISALNDLLDSHRVFLLAALEASLLQPGINFEKLVAYCDAITMRWLVAGLNAQVLENLFQAEARRILQSDIPEAQRMEEVLASFQEHLPSDEMMRNRLNESNFKIPLARVTLTRINEVLHHNQGVIDYAAQKVNVEHIAPQTASEYWYEALGIDSSLDSAPVRYRDAVTRIGNLTLLEYKLNSGIKNADWDTKRFGIPGKHDKSYSDTVLKVAITVRETDVWDERAIMNRTEWISQMFLEIWNLGGGLVPTKVIKPSPAPAPASSPEVAPSGGTEEDVPEPIFDEFDEIDVEDASDTQLDYLHPSPCCEVATYVDDEGNRFCPECGTPVYLRAMAGSGCPNCGSREIDSDGRCEHCQALVGVTRRPRSI